MSEMIPAVAEEPKMYKINIRKLVGRGFFVVVVLNIEMS